MDVTFHTGNGPVTISVDIDAHLGAVSDIANTYHDCSEYEHLGDAIEERANNCVADMIDTHYLKARERKFEELYPKRPQEC